MGSLTTQLHSFFDNSFKFTSVIILNNIQSKKSSNKYYTVYVMFTWSTDNVLSAHQIQQSQSFKQLAVSVL